MRNAFIIASIILGTFAGGALSASAQGLHVMHAQIAESKGAARTGAGYLVVMNGGDVDDRLMSVEADFPRVELHNIEEVDGVTSMVRQDAGIAVSAGEHLVLAPGGYHIMFMGLATPFNAGDKIMGVAVFETAGRIPVEFLVVPHEELHNSGHGEMNHGDHGDHGDHDGHDHDGHEGHEDHGSN